MATTSTTTYTEGSYTSSSVTVSKTTSLSDQTPGPANPYVGLDHDYDVIWLWLNPVQLFTVHEDANNGIQYVEYNGLGFSTLDQSSMEVYPVYVGWLNGDIAMTTDQAKPPQRVWAASESWPAGQGPALTSADFQNIVQADPYWQCTPNPSGCPKTVDGTRFTQTPLNQNVVYVQAPVGGQPLTQMYTEGYTGSSTQGQGGSYSLAQAFGWEQTFGTSLFGIGLKTTLQLSDTLTWTNTWDSSLTNSNTSTAETSITGPPCVVSGLSCVPPCNGTTEFALYEDNLYGTFMFYPLN